jgi:chromosome partitioning protein
MKVISVVSQKGGSGKSCNAAHLSVLAEQEGETCVVVDLDDQANLVAFGEVRGEAAPDIAGALPSHLKKVLKAAADNGATIAFVDTPSKMDEAALAAIRAADLILVPTRCGLFDLVAIRDTVKVLQLAGRLKDAVAVVNDFDAKHRETVVAEVTAELKKFGLAVVPVSIPHRTPLETALKMGKGITEAQPKSVAAAEMRELWAFLKKRLSK